MRKLLSANFSRLWKDKTFWFETIFMFGLGIFIVCTKYSDMLRYHTNERLDDVLLSYILYIGFCSAIFCSMFSGTEYSDGTIRNKLIAGHFRSTVYLSNWLTGIAAVFIMSFAFLLSYCALGSFLLEAPGTPPEQILFYLLISFFTVIAFTSTFTMLSMLITRKATSAVTCLIVFIGLFMLALIIKARLEAPEFISEYNMTPNGIEQSEPLPNPKYLQPAARKVYQLFLDMLPTGQSLQLSALAVPNPFLTMIYSIIISAATTVLGFWSFQKKNLN